MTEESLPYRHGIHEAVGVLTGQWVTAVLATLAAQPMTYTRLFERINEIEEQVGWVTHDRPISQKVLTGTLQRMQRDGLLIKIERPSAFGYTWYQLTAMGRSLLRALQPLAKWAEDNRKALAEARRAYLAEHPDRTNIR